MFWCAGVPLRFRFGLVSYHPQSASLQASLLVTSRTEEQLRSMADGLLEAVRGLWLADPCLSVCLSETSLSVWCAHFIPTTNAKTKRKLISSRGERERVLARGSRVYWGFASDLPSKDIFS